MTKQTYNTQDKHKKPQKLTNKAILTLVYLPLAWKQIVYILTKRQLSEPVRGYLLCVKWDTKLYLLIHYPMLPTTAAIFAYQCC